ncbi:MAG: hypothetical protein M3Z87_16145 [Lactobacillus sp.]|nr:hypothetical protein [Lactobacillus sp.]
MKLTKKEELKEAFSNRSVKCKIWFLLFLVSTAAVFLWKTKIAIFIQIITIIYFLNNLISAYIVYRELKKKDKAERDAK